MTARHFARRFSRSGLQIALIVTTTHTVAAAMAADEPQTFPRLRAQGVKIADAIAQGVERSPTFRRLVESIDATDGLVYVAEGECGHSARACLEGSIVIAGRNRVLRIFVNPRRAPGCQLVEVIGHELQHAMEVLSNPTVRSGAAMFNLFDRIGKTGFARFETSAALRTGLNVAREACRS